MTADAPLDLSETYALFAETLRKRNAELRRAQADNLRLKIELVEEKKKRLQEVEAVRKQGDEIATALRAEIQRRLTDDLERLRANVSALTLQDDMGSVNPPAADSPILSVSPPAVPSADDALRAKRARDAAA